MPVLKGFPYSGVITLRAEGIPFLCSRELIEDLGF